jgi:hypothetical protein
VRRMIEASNFREEKHRYARRWLYRREHALGITAAVIAAGGVIAAIAGVIVATAGFVFRRHSQV